jgi:hypothetical protein
VTAEDAVYFTYDGIVMHPRYSPEQHLWVNCLRKNGKDIKFSYQRDVSGKAINDTEQYFVSNFIFISWPQFNLRPPKKFNDYLKNDYDTCITHYDYAVLYKKYLDCGQLLPAIDEEREIIRKKRKRRVSNIYLIRKTRNGLRCWKENGLYYTIRLFIKKVLRKIGALK